jgi:hypothetical protein
MHDRHPRTLIACALAAFAVAVSLALAACGGSDSAGWGAPESLGARVGHMSVAFAGDGRALAVWTEERRGEHRLMFAERPPGAGWGASEPIIEDRQWSILAPKLVANARGDAVVTFSFWARQSTVVMGSYRSAGGRWEEPQALAPVSRNLGEGIVGMGDRGEVVAAWNAYGDGLRMSRREAGAGWRDPAPVAIEAYPFGAQVAVAPDGRAYLLVDTVSRRGVVGPASLLVNDGGDGWTRRPGPSDAGGRVDAVELVVDRDGRPTVVGFRPGRRPGSGTLVVSRLGADGEWSAPRVLDRAHLRWFGPVEIASTDEGVAVAWARWTQPLRKVSVRAALIRDGRPAAATVEVDAFEVPQGRRASQPWMPDETLRLAAGARPALVWARPTAPRPRLDAQLMTSRFSAGAWSAPEPITDGTTAPRPAAIHSDDARDVVLWGELPLEGGGRARIVAAERATD